MLDCLCSGPVTNDYYYTDMMKMLRQVITFNMTQILTPSFHFPLPLLLTIINKKSLACDMHKHTLSARDDMWFDSLPMQLESTKQLILTVLGFGFSWVAVEPCCESLWSLAGNLVLQRHWNRATDKTAQREIVWNWKKHALLQRLFSVRGENSVIRNTDACIKLSHCVLSISLLFRLLFWLSFNAFAS